MDFGRNEAAGSTGAMNRYACTGCGALTADDPGCATVRSKRMAPGQYAFACPPCAQRAAISPTFRRQVEIAAAAGQPLPEAERVFASLGVAVPTTLAEFDVALRLPLGTMAAMFGGGR